MRILVVTTDFLPNVSGVATLAYQQAKGLADVGHDVLVLTAIKGSRQWSREAKDNFQVQEHETGLPPIIRLISFIGELKSVVEKWKPDFIWCANYRGFGLPVMRIARKLRLPYGLYMHGTELVTEKRNSARSYLIRSAMRNAKVLCTNSNSTSNLLRKLYSLHSDPITPGVDIPPEETPEFTSKVDAIRTGWLADRKETLQNEPIIFVSCSRISRQKGIHTVIQAISALDREVQKRVLYVVGGKGPAESEFKKLTSELGIEDHVIFNGMAAREDLPAILKAADVYLQPSQPEEGFLEGFGISFLEAQSVGLPCIASNWCGIPEAVKSGVTALLVPTGSVEAVAGAVTRVVSDDSWRATAAKAGPIWAAENSWDRHAEKLSALITT